MIGDQEQYAVTAALMARQLGFPARVVFGFAPTIVSVSGPTPIRGSDISAWIEVDTTQFGWVTIDPNPPVRKIPEEQPKDPTQVARPQSPVQPPAQQPLTHENQTPPDSTQDNPVDVNALLEIVFAVLRIAGWTILALAVVLSPFLAIVAAKHRRRVLRRRAPRAVDRMSGGWQEFEDAVRRSRIPDRSVADPIRGRCDSRGDAAARACVCRRQSGILAQQPRRG